MARHDPHSYADDAQPQVARFAWRATVGFTSRTLECEVDLHFVRPSHGQVDLDSRGLTIHRVVGATYVLHTSDPILGARLELTLPAQTERVTIAYRTAPDASALQWLEPSQTHGGQQPFLFSQCQAIHARSVVPLQDSPKCRVPFDAQLTVPKALRAVMGAAPVSRVEQGEVAIETFTMPQPIPPYLLAFAVGDVASRELSARSRVWAEPGVVDAAAREFDQVEAMMQAAESLYGPYDWERFDILTMPPSFPYGGMENPRLTFVTPALVVGDKSLVDVIAHELAHSWTGNLVTNANAEHFWLNEGFTVYAERRIIEVLHGAEQHALASALGRRELDAAVAQFHATPELTRLRTQLSGVDPDEAFSVVPYEKGFLFLVLLEQHVGRVAFDAMLKAYLRAHRFGAVTTDDFLGVVERTFPGLLTQVNASAWLDGAGVPTNAPSFRSARLSAVEALGTTAPDAALAARWSPTEWVLWLDRMPRGLAPAALAALESQCALTHAKNPEVAVAWVRLALSSGDRSVLPRCEQLLGTYGRMKYLKPLYTQLMASPAFEGVGGELFARFRSRYHPIAQAVVAKIVSR
jgi:leukotriene-A4 hydrolase